MIKVVIVDDENWNRDIIRTFGQWEQYGMEIAGEAEDGLEAVRVIEEVSPQIVITDMRMPGADGVKLLRILNDRYPDIRIVVVSGYEDFDYAKHAIRYRAVDYLLKPIDPKELNAVLLKCKAELELANEEKRLLFMDFELAQTLKALKQRLRHHFNDLNAEGVLGVFGQMTVDLAAVQGMRLQLLERVVQEMMLFLKELTVDNSLDLETADEPVSQAALASPKEAVAFLLLHYMQALEQLTPPRKDKNKINMEEGGQYIERQFDNPGTLEHLAKVFFVSKEYLSKVFKQQYGRNVTDFLLQIRMEKARDWLLDEHLSIKAVAEMAGYEDVSYFYRVFRKYFGIAPGEMKKQADEV